MTRQTSDGAMPGATGRRPREPLPDALRALALIGVLLVNVLGYREAPEGRLLGDVLPQDGVWGHGLLVFIATFVQGKAYPLLAFLFGMGLAYSARGLDSATALAASRRRARRLLLLGIAHGVLLYFGDILTLYSVCGWWVARQVREPWRVLRPRLRRAVVWAFVACAAAVGLMFAATADTEPLFGRSIGGTSGWTDWLALNASAYAMNQTIGLLLMLPIVRLCMLSGIAGARLRVLTHRRWHTAMDRQWHGRLWAVLALNAAYGVAYVGVPPTQAEAALVLNVISPMVTLPLAALYVMGASRLWRQGRRAWVAPLAALGQHTLSAYVLASVLMLLLFSGAGAGWPVGPLGGIIFTIGLWLAAWGASHQWPGRWPLERWMARR